MGPDTPRDRVAPAPLAVADAALEENSQARSRRRIVVAVSCGFFALVLGAWLWLFFADAVPPDDPALRLERWPEVPDEENGAWLYREAMLAVDHGALLQFLQLDVRLRISDSINLCEEPSPELVLTLRDPLREAVSAQSRSLEWLARAASAPGYAPEWHFPPSQLGNVPDEMGQVVHLAAVERWFDADPEGAWKLLLGPRTLLRATSERPRSSDDLNWAVAHQRMLLGPLRLFLALSPERTPEQLGRWLATLETPLLAEGWRSRQLRRDAMLVDVWIADPTSVRMLGLGLDPDSLWFRPGRTRVRFAELHREWIASASEGWEEPWDPNSPPWRRKMVGYLGGNRHGEQMVHVWQMTQDWSFALPAAARSAVLMDELARTVIALRLHRHARGEWPESLGALVPAFIPAIPRDPHDPAGGPLQWSKEALALWSVGRDRAVLGPAPASLSRFDQILAPTPTVRFGGTGQLPAVDR